MPQRTAARAASGDQESRDWLRALRGEGAERDQAMRALHELLLRASRFELGRRRAWQDREVVLDADAWPAVADRRTAVHEALEQTELLDELRDAISTALTPHQRQVFVALALNEVPIDVLAERLGTSRGALYKTLHDARRTLRRELGLEHS
jgi:RNA polymerase sigma factor (sigma-70 family)